MEIKNLQIKGFGKLRKTNIEFSNKINVLYGPNESGKSTLHSFIRAMLYGMEKGRGRASKNDGYNRFLPWDKTTFGGNITIESMDKTYTITRDFSKKIDENTCICKETGELIPTNNENLYKILGNVTPIIYDNTVSIAQLKSVTGKDLAMEVKNYMANYQGLGDNNLDIGRTMQMLKIQKKGFKDGKAKVMGELEKSKVTAESKIDLVSREIEDLENKIKVGNARLREGDSDKTQKYDFRPINMKINIFGIIGIIILLGSIFLMAMNNNIILGVLGLILGALTLCYDGYLIKGKKTIINKIERSLGNKRDREEKLRWQIKNIQADLDEKNRQLNNLVDELKEIEKTIYMPLNEDIEMNAIDMAMETIVSLSSSFKDRVGIYIKQRAGEIFGEITEGKYTSVIIDGDFSLSIIQDNKIIPIERLSRGTVEQIYFALRMAVGEIFLGDNKFPLIFDDTFGMYDRQRLGQVLKWLHKENRQVIISTCHLREIEILKELNIPFNLIEM